jgi:uncharacterized protein DUF29
MSEPSGNNGTEIDMSTKTDWQELIYTRSEADVLQEIHAAIDRGDYLDGMAGLEEMIHLMSRRDERELESRLAILMAHILKWQTQAPTRSWRNTINTQRREIARLRRYAPRFTQERIQRDFWEVALADARRHAEDDMNCSPAVDTLTWKEVFETEYRLPAE